MLEQTAAGAKHTVHIVINAVSQIEVDDTNH
jgi:hypothetical protein